MGRKHKRTSLRRKLKHKLKKQIKQTLNQSKQQLSDQKIPRLPWFTVSFIETLLLQLLIFLIPTNLWLGLSKNQATVNGIIVDYLIPKIYITDFIVLALFFIWIVKSLRHPTRLFRQVLQIAPYLLCLIPIVLSILQSHYPQTGFWFLVKLLEVAFLLVWTYQHRVSLKIFSWPLIVGITFQSIIGLVQWIQKSSLIGFLFLGETSLKISSNIAKTTLGGEIRPLPYGTTPHPNILAGFIVIGLITLLVIRKNKLVEIESSRIWYFVKTALTLSFLGMALTTLLLTQSVTAITALIIGLLLIRGHHFHPLNLLSLVGIVVALALFVYPNLDQESITRRVELGKISLEMISTRPLLGVGLNNFTAVMSNFGHIPGPSRFLQPVHNIYLLWFAETGLAGSLPILWFVWDHRHRLVGVIWKKLPLFTPLLVLMSIGLLDHYPLTLQTGQLLVWLCVAVTLADENFAKGTKLNTASSA